MMQRWEPDMVRFMRDASEYGSYNRALADYIACRIPQRSHVCDAGCGLGYLSLEMAKRVQRVTAVDINADALCVLKENCLRQHADHIDIRCGDIELLTPEKPYDAMVFCFFGSISEVLHIAQKQCCADVFMISRNYSRHRFSVGEHCVSYGGYKEACRRLSKIQIPFERQEMSLDLGQPFANLDDARLFFQLYSKDKDHSGITDDFLWSKLKKVDHVDFPLYMPHMREVGIVHFHVKDIPRITAVQEEIGCTAS